MLTPTKPCGREKLKESKLKGNLKSQTKKGIFHKAAGSAAVLKVFLEASLEL